MLRFRVTLDKASTETVTVHYATADVTATAGGDYEPAVGILEFAPGETEKWVEVVLIDDPVEDSGETFVLRLTDAVGARMEASEGVGTIRNSEHDTIVSEGDMDFPADTTTTGRVAVGGSATGEIEADGDLDWFGVTLEANRTYQFDLEGSRTGAGTLSDPFLRGIHDTSGNLIDGTTNDDKGIGRNSRVTLIPTQAGTYYVSAGAWSDREGTYTLRVADVTSGIPDDLPADTTTTGTVAVGGTATGEIEYNGDHDWFAVTLAAGRNYRFDLEGTETNGGTMYNPYLRGIHDSSGTLIPGTTDDDDGACRNSRLTFTPTQAGAYYVSAGGWSDQEGTYTLRVTDDTDGIADDYTAGTNTAGRVAVGGTATGEIEYNDSEDWFAVTLAVGKTYRFDLEGSVTSGGTLTDPYLRGIYDADGNLIAGTTNDENGVGRNSRVDFTATAAGAYYVSAGAWSDREGTYTLRVTDVSDGITDDYTAGTGTSGTLAVGGTATGEIEYGSDHDWFAVMLETGKSYRFGIEGSPSANGYDSLLTPYLSGLHDADGDLIAGTADSDDDGRVDFTATDAGTYYVAASTYGEHHGTYTLSVEEVM